MPTYRIPELKLPLDHGKDDMERRVCAILGTAAANIASISVERKSFDARDRTDIRIIYCLSVELKSAVKGRRKGRTWSAVEKVEGYSSPPRPTGPGGKKPPAHREALGRRLCSRTVARS